VDAALDATNVARVAHYLRNRTREEQRKRDQYDADSGGKVRVGSLACPAARACCLARVERLRARSSVTHVWAACLSLA
jgi:hypothetical protein